MTSATVAAAITTLVLLVFAARAWKRGWYSASGGSLFAAFLLFGWLLASPAQLAQFLGLWLGGGQP